MANKVFTQQKIFDLVITRPGISAPSIADELGITRVSAYRHLKTLISLLKVQTKWKGKATRYFPHETTYFKSNIDHRNGLTLTESQIQRLKHEVVQSINEAYGEDETEEAIDKVFETYCMYIASDDTVITGFNAFIAWCTDPKHGFADKIVPKAVEYLEIIWSIEYRRKKNGFLDGTESANANLNGIMAIWFDKLYFLMPSVIENGFWRTRTAIELYYGKLNNRLLLEHAIEKIIDPVKLFIKDEGVDAYVLTPPTNNRTTQFRDLLDSTLNIKLPKISAGKAPPLGRVLQPQKDIKDRVQRVNNALLSLEVVVPKELESYKHILILDDSFTTGATPNAIAVRLREAGYTKRITVITVCGSFSYELAITEDEI
jgi:hypothetical protein